VKIIVLVLITNAFLNRANSTAIVLKEKFAQIILMKMENMELVRLEKIANGMMTVEILYATKIVELVPKVPAA
jgi:hypothetical protein